jgi:hypothetical protein
VLPPRSAPQILSAEDEVAGYHIVAVFNGDAQVLQNTRDDKGVRCQRQKWMRWSVLTILFKRNRAKPILHATVYLLGMRRLSLVRGVSYEPVVLLRVSTKPK